MYRVLVSRTFQRQFHRLAPDTQDRIRSALRELENDPLRARANADIKALKDTKPQKHRLRVGEYRIIYCVKGDTVKVVEIFRRGRGYRKQ